MSEIKIIDNQISLKELQEVASERFGDMIKVVVDVKKEIMAIGGEMHYDEEQILLQNDSKQENLWGINLYVELTGDEFIEYDSMINIRPNQNNRSRYVEHENIRKLIAGVVGKLIEKK